MCVENSTLVLVEKYDGDITWHVHRGVHMFVKHGVVYCYASPLFTMLGVGGRG